MVWKVVNLNTTSRHCYSLSCLADIHWLNCTLIRLYCKIAMCTALEYVLKSLLKRRPASTHRTARHQFQATGQPVRRTQASDTITSRLLHYEAKCAQRRCLQWGSVPLRSDIQGTELRPANILMPLEWQLIALQLCRWQLLYNETLQQTFCPLMSKLSERRQI